MQKKQLTAKQEAELNSFRSTEQHIDENLSVIAGIIAFMATYNQIMANIASIFEYEQEKSASLTGIASNKNTLRETLSNTTLTIAGVVETYAEDINDLQLRGEMKLNITTLKRKRDDELAPFCQFFHDRAAAHLTALKDYNITAAGLAELQALIDSYRAESPKPRTAVKTRKVTNANLAAVFRATRKLFEKLDKQIESLRKQHPVFVKEYFATRERNNAPSKTMKPKELETADGNEN